MANATICKNGIVVEFSDSVTAIGYDQIDTINKSKSTVIISTFDGVETSVELRVAVFAKEFLEDALKCWAAFSVDRLGGPMDRTKIDEFGAVG